MYKSYVCYLWKQTEKLKPTITTFSWYGVCEHIASFEYDRMEIFPLMWLTGLNFTRPSNLLGMQSVFIIFVSIIYPTA